LKIKIHLPYIKKFYLVITHYQSFYQHQLVIWLNPY